jgi:hypothetical protein
MITLPNGVEIPEEDLHIWQTYDNRCIVHPNVYAVCLHENPPKSLNPSWKSQPWTRYALCNDCHTRVHNMSRIERDLWLTFERNKNFPHAEATLCQM